jgi:hypothetical protein
MVARGGFAQHYSATLRLPVDGIMLRPEAA